MSSGAAGTPAVNVVPFGLRQPRIHQYNATFEREIGWGSAVRFSYLGSTMHGLIAGKDLDELQPSDLPFGTHVLDANGDPAGICDPLSQDPAKNACDFQDIDAILRLGEFLHRARENRRFATRELRTFFIHPVLVRNNFQEKRDVTARAFRADALDPNPLALLYFWCIGQGIVQQNFNGVCAGVNQSAHGPVLQKPRKARRNFRVVPTYFVGHQQA